MKHTLNGTAKVPLRDGAVKSINLGEILRKRRATRSALPARRRPASAGGKAQQTDFTELSASFTIKNGIAPGEDLDTRAPAFRLGGAGDINIPASTLDYVVKASIVTTSRGQGGKERDDLSAHRASQAHRRLRRPQVPGRRACAGWTGGQSQLGARVKQEIEQNRGKLEERLGDKLKGLLGR